jgi:TatD DNase family protein
MLIDTHCHLNIIVKNNFDTPLQDADYELAKAVINDARVDGVDILINVGTSLIESKNCIEIARRFEKNYAVIGIHPNDITSAWKQEIKELDTLAAKKNDLKIVGIGECGMDFHYPDYNVQLQKDVFRAHIELALKHDLALVVHTRDARDETLQVIEEYHKEIKHGIIHCFSEDADFARQVISWGFALGLGGTITYPKNIALREIAASTPLSHIVLETDAPFLPPQSMRGKKNYPANIALIATYLAELKQISVEEVAEKTTLKAREIFSI